MPDDDEINGASESLDDPGATPPVGSTADAAADDDTAAPAPAAAGTGGASTDPEATEPAVIEPVVIEPVTDGAGAAEPVVLAAVTPSRHLHRTWPQRMLLTLNCTVVLACFVAAAGLIVGRNYRGELNTVSLEHPLDTVSTAPTASAPATTVVPVSLSPGETAPPETAPVETYPALVDPAARNFLITGADNASCVDPDSPYAAAFGDRSEGGERSDTIMVIRLDPSTQRAAVLSFPRDLWVNIDGAGKGKINWAYDRDDPRRLVNTLAANGFEVPIDHFIQIDFCAFKRIVDSIGGVAVPFTVAAKDSHTGFQTNAGCVTLSGDAALAYLRSRHYYYQREDGKFVEDPAADFGRVSRQQDFIRRMLAAVLKQGVPSPTQATGLINGVLDNVVFDDQLSIATMIEYIGVLRNVDPSAIATYQIESKGQNIGGQAAQVPALKGENMQAILAIFRGNAPLAGAPEQVFEPDVTVPTATTVAPTGESVTPTESIAPEETVATVPGPDQNTKGIVPDPTATC